MRYTSNPIHKAAFLLGLAAALRDNEPTTDFNQGTIWYGKTKPPKNHSKPFVKTIKKRRKKNKAARKARRQNRK